MPDSLLTSHLALVVEDDHDFAAELVGILAAEGWSAASTSEGAAAVDHVRERSPDLVLLDLMLPDIDGVDVLRRIRAFSDAYVLVVSRRDGEQSKIDALRAGADDYLTKPVSPRELVARVEAVMRRPRSNGGADGALVFGDLAVFTRARRVTLGGDEVDLTRIEFELLRRVALAGGDAVTRGVLFAGVWGADPAHDNHLLDVHVSNLRRKIESDPRRPSRLRTIRGVGFRLDA